MLGTEVPSSKKSDARSANGSGDASRTGVGGGGPAGRKDSSNWARAAQGEDSHSSLPSGGISTLGGGVVSSGGVLTPVTGLATTTSDISKLMSQVELVSPPPGETANTTQTTTTVSSPPALPATVPSPSLRPASPARRTPSPKPSTAAATAAVMLTARQAAADQMDALPSTVRTPRKSILISASSTATDSRVLPASLHATSSVMNVDLEPLPRFLDVSESQWAKLFSKKALQCEQLFDFSLPLLDLRNKELKTVALTDLLWVTMEHAPGLGEQQYQEIFSIFAKNVFRSLPPRQNPTGEAFDPEDDEPVYDASWPHTHLVYELFIRLVESSSFNVNIARKYIDQGFVHRLLMLFDVEDPRERDMVKTTVHRVYGKFLNLRAFIRKAMRHIFYEFVYEDERHNVAEMLEILGSVVNGFAVPLREEHKVFLERTLIPLHKNRLLPVYYQQLSLCVVQFAEKDAQLVEKIILGLLRIWPKTNTTKEIMFLNEVEEVLEVTPPELFPRFLVPLCQQLARSLASPHFQVAERALAYWNNDYLVGVIGEQHSDVVLPILLPALLRYSRLHWNKNVQLQVYNVLRLFMEMNPRLYEQLARSVEANGSVDNERRASLWQQVEVVAERQRHLPEKENTYATSRSKDYGDAGGRPRRSISEQEQTIMMDMSNRTGQTGFT